MGTDIYIDAAGSPRILPEVVGMAKYHAPLMVTAVYGEAVPLQLGTMLTKGLSLTTAVRYPTEMPEVLAALPRIQETGRSLISHRLAFDDVLDGFAIAGTPGSAKVMVQIS